MPPVLLFCAPAPVSDAPSGHCLDIKFVEGMRAHVAAWNGPMQCVLWRGGGAIPFGRTYAAADLGFSLTVLDPGAPIPRAAFDGATVAMISADLPGFAAMVRDAESAGVPVVAGLEYTLETRLQILRLDPSIGMARKIRRALRLWGNDRRMTAALRRLAGVQFNGYPAFDAYAGGTPNPMMYLDNRMTPALLASDAEMQTRAARLRTGAPLRLIHSGRLEPMKGAQDLLPLMAALRQRGVRATLDIWGRGSLEADIAAGLPAFGGDVRLHGSVDFETELVPITRRTGDIFVSCHRQSDPSCTYLEAMGCGLALVGYDNRMWSRLNAAAGLDAAVSPLRPEALAARIAAWDRDRGSLVRATEAALAFARQHDFPTEFAARAAHLDACAGVRAGQTAPACP